MVKGGMKTGLELTGRLAAIPYGYLLTALATSCLARLLPTSRVEAATTGMLLSFALYAVILLWAFAAHNVVRLWLWLGGAGLVLGGILTLSILTGGRA
jgi:hypothetical protein